MPFYKADEIEVLIDEKQLISRIAELGQQITSDYADGRPVVLVGVLKGSFLFLADLCRHIVRSRWISSASSYGDSEECSGVVQVTQDLSRSVEGKHVIVVEDIVDTGLTMAYLLENLATRRPASVRIASLLHKPARAKVEVAIDYLGFEIPDRFVVGYGLDYANKLRNLPFIGVNVGGGQPF